MTQDQWVQVLTFSGGLVGLVSTFLVALPQISDPNKVLIGAGVTLIVGVIDLALGVFFKVKKPIAAAFKAGQSAK